MEVNENNDILGNNNEMDNSSNTLNQYWENNYDLGTSGISNSSSTREQTTFAEESSEINNVSNQFPNNTEPAKEPPIFEEVEIKKSLKEIRNESYYDGSLLETIGWNLLSGIITVLTFTLGKPWGDCMVLRYKINHTILNGKRLNFEGTGGELFVERFKWIFLTIITLTIYAWFIPMKKMKWILKHIHFEDEPLVSGESYFNGKLIQLIGLNILSSILTFISLGLLYPFTNCLKLKWLAKHSIINKKKIVFNGKALSLWGHYILWFILTIITFGIFGLWLGIKMRKWEVKNSHIKIAGEEEVKSNNLILIPIFMVCLILGGFVVFNFILPNIDEIGEALFKLTPFGGMEQAEKPLDYPDFYDYQHTTKYN